MCSDVGFSPYINRDIAMLEHHQGQEPTLKDLSLPPPIPRENLFESLWLSLFEHRLPLRKESHERVELIGGLRKEEGDDYFLSCRSQRSEVTSEATEGIEELLLKRFGEYGIEQLKGCHGTFASEAFSDMYRVGALEKLSFSQIDFVARRYGTLPYHPNLKDASGSSIGQTCIETTLILASLKADNWRIVTRHPSVVYSPPTPGDIEATEREVFRRMPSVAPYAPASSPQVVLTLADSLERLGHRLHRKPFGTIDEVIARGKLAVGDVLLIECADPAFGGDRERQLQHDREFHKWKIIHSSLKEGWSPQRAEFYVRGESRYSVTLGELREIWEDGLEKAKRELKKCRTVEEREALQSLAGRKMDEMRREYASLCNPLDKKPNFHVAMVVGAIEDEPYVAEVSAGRPKSPFAIVPLKSSASNESRSILFRAAR